MGYKSSDAAFKPGAVVRQIYFTGVTGDTLYPDAPDDKWRLLRLCAVDYIKTVAAGRHLTIAIRREGLADDDVIWKRYMAAAETTNGPADLQQAEQTADSNAYMVPSVAVVGANGVIIPPRTQFILTISSTTGCSIRLSTQFVETVDPLDMIQFV